MSKIYNRIAKPDLKRADLYLQNAQCALKKTSMDERGVPDLALNSKRKYREGKIRNKLLGRNKITLLMCRQKPKFRWV